MLTKEVLFGMNLVSLAGFVLMGVGLTLNRQGVVRFSVAFALMGAGTALVFLGLHVAPPANPQAHSTTAARRLPRLQR